MQKLSLIASAVVIGAVLAAGVSLSMDSSMKYFGGCVSLENGLSRCVLMPTVDAWFVWMGMASGLIMLVSVGRYAWKAIGASASERRGCG